MPIFVLFLSPPERPRILCVPTCKTSQSEQPSIHVPHFMNYNTDCSNSSRLPLVDHTDQFHQTQFTPFYRGLCGTHRFTYSHQNSYTYRSHQPNDFHADSQSANLLRPTGSRLYWIVWKTHSVKFHVLVLESSSNHHQSWSTWSHDTEDVTLQRNFWYLQWFGHSEVTNLWRRRETGSVL